MFRSAAPHSADILRFPVQHYQGNNLTTSDRIEALRWEEVKALGIGARLAFHRSSDCDPSENGDYISIYCANDPWASWGMARRGRSITVWQCATGADLGHFATMPEALAAVKAAFRRRQS